MNVSNHSFMPRPAFPGQSFIPLADAVKITGRIENPIFRAIYEQLPEGVARRVDVSLKTDCYYLATRATFATADGRAFDVTLKPMLVDGVWASAQVPVEFIAHLCVAL